MEKYLIIITTLTVVNSSFFFILLFGVAAIEGKLGRIEKILKSATSVKQN